MERRRRSSSRPWSSSTFSPSSFLSGDRSTRWYLIWSVVKVKIIIILLQVSEDHDWEGERVVMTDRYLVFFCICYFCHPAFGIFVLISTKLWSTVTRQGKTNIRGVASLVEDKNEVLMWNISSPFSHLFRWEVDLFYVLSEYTMISKLQHIFFQETNLEAIIAKLSSTLSHLAIPNVRLEAHQNGLLKRGSDDVKVEHWCIEKKWHSCLIMLRSYPN